MFDTDDSCPICDEPTVVVLVREGERIREVVIDPEEDPRGNLVWSEQHDGQTFFRVIRKQDGEPPVGIGRYSRHACHPALAGSGGSRERGTSES